VLAINYDQLGVVAVPTELGIPPTGNWFEILQRIIAVRVMAFYGSREFEVAGYLETFKMHALFRFNEFR
jgi:hypothetical protein